MEDKDCSIMLYEDIQQSRLLSDFFEQRLAFIRENKYPTMLTTDPACRFVMYLIPQKFRETIIDIKKFDDPSEYLIPLGEAENTVMCDFNFDGIVFLSSVHVKHSYIQLFRDGKIETVVAIARFASDARESYLPLIKLQKTLPRCLRSHLDLLDKNNVPGPYNLYFRLLSAEGLRIEPKDVTIAGYDVKGRNKALIRNNLDFPIHRFEHADIDMPACLQPFFDTLWNTFGFSGAPLEVR